MRLRIGPFRYIFTVVDFLPDSLGATKKAQGIMQVVAGQAPDQEREAALHEVLHAIWDQSGLRNREDDEEELVVSSLSPGLFDFLRDNPRFLEYLTE